MQERLKHPLRVRFDIPIDSETPVQKQPLSDTDLCLKEQQFEDLHRGPLDLRLIHDLREHFQAHGHLRRRDWPSNEGYSRGRDHIQRFFVLEKSSRADDAG
jgi:hypothetical protein